MREVKIEAYIGKGDSLSDEATKVLERVRDEMPFLLKEIDITLDEDLFRRYKDEIPVIYINGRKSFKFKVDENEFRKRVRKEVIKARMSIIADRKTRMSLADG